MTARADVRKQVEARRRRPAADANTERFLNGLPGRQVSGWQVGQK
jgi:hypothetical protein